MAEKPLTWWRSPSGKHKRECSCLCVNEITSALICAGRETFGCYSIIISPITASQNTCTVQTCDHVDRTKSVESVAALKAAVRLSSHDDVTFGEKTAQAEKWENRHWCSESISALSLNSTCCAVVRTTAFQVPCAQTLQERSTKHTGLHMFVAITFGKRPNVHPG